MSQAWSYQHQCRSTTKISGLVSLSPPLPYIPGISHSQQVALPPHPHQTPGNPGVPFYSSSSAPFFEKAVKMCELFWSSSFFPSLISFFSISLAIRVISDAGKTSLWSKTFPMIFRYYSAHFWSTPSNP